MCVCVCACACVCVCLRFEPYFFERVLQASVCRLSRCILGYYIRARCEQPFCFRLSHENTWHYNRLTVCGSRDMCGRVLMCVDVCWGEVEDFIKRHAPTLSLLTRNMFHIVDLTLETRTRTCLLRVFSVSPLNMSRVKRR